MSSDTCKRMMSDGDACVNTTTDTDVAPATIRAIVAGHGSFASGIISAVEQITGKGASFLAMSNTGLGPMTFRKRSRARSTTPARTSSLPIYPPAAAPWPCDA